MDNSSVYDLLHSNNGGSLFSALKKELFYLKSLLSAYELASKLPD
ncbi:hypothetical protein N499_0137 [Wolbachia pipientis wVitA]|nr:hypothetical protein N499_0137 [Wolbachia pipientis wVitA]